MKILIPVKEEEDLMTPKFDPLNITNSITRGLNPINLHWNLISKPSEHFMENVFSP